MFICICIIVGLNSKDPFESYIIGNLTKYFNILPNITNSNDNINSYDKKEQEQSYKEKNLPKEGLNISSNARLNRGLFKRKLKSFSFCRDIRESFIRNERKNFHIFLNWITKLFVDFQ